jgi:WXG100 family type VII secretion target
MSQIHVNPEEMRAFAAQLKRFSNELQASLKQTEGRLEHLNQSWRDQENAKFAQKFRQATKALHPLIQQMQEYEVFLKKKAKAADVYRNIQ